MATQCPKGITADLWAKVKTREALLETPVDPQHLAKSRLPKMVTILHA